MVQNTKCPQSEPKPTIRERLAATKRKARMVIDVNKALLLPLPEPPPPPEPEPPEMDAVLVRASHDLRLADRAIMALSEGPYDLDDAPGYAALDGARDVILDTLEDTAAEGLPGLRAKAQATLTRNVTEIYEDGLRLGKSLARDILRAKGAAIELQPDPIFAVIEEARRLNKAHEAFDEDEEREIELLAFDAYCKDVLFKTVPDTAAGCAALARYAIEYYDRCDAALDEDVDKDSRENCRILALIARSPLL